MYACKSKKKTKCNASLMNLTFIGYIEIQMMSKV